LPFADRAATFVDEFFARYPHWATSIGEHRYDDRWPDTSDAGRDARLTWIDAWIAELASLDGATLSDDERLDRDLLVGELDALRFAEGELRDDAWDPMDWVYLLGFGLFPLTARSFAPLATRLASVAGRLEGIPRLLEDAKAVLGSLPGRPVSRLHAETAAKRIDGVAEIGRDALREGESAAAAGDAATAAILPRLRVAEGAASEAIAAFGVHLRDVVLPASDGQGLLGRDRFTAKLRHTLRDPEATPEALLEVAEREFRAVRSEMLRLATELWPGLRPGEPVPDDETALVRGVLDVIAQDHPRADELLDVCIAEVARIEAFCRDHDVITLVDEPLDIRWTPEFLRSFGGAMLDWPGALDKGEKAFFAITPVNEDWTPEQVESYLRENNHRQLRLLTIHEAVPGHYLHGVYANRVHSLIRSVFRSGLTAEGWAVYVTQVLMDLGFAGDDLALWLVHWKFYLRSVTNAIIDVRIHTGGMTTEEAVRFMVEGGFQEEAEARAKDDRARLSSTQLSTYFMGSRGMWDLEDEARRRAAQVAGAGRDAVPTPAVVGGYGETPGFRYRAHLEEALAHGMPPIPLVRRAVLRDEPD
jgi:uncharacterized protein (DUF885 family)